MATTTDETKEEKTEVIEAADEHDEEMIKSVAERLKFFFSDANIRQDRFMRNHMMQQNKSDPGGYVPIVSLLRFNTIKNYTTDANAVIKAAKSLPDILTVKSDNTGIGRVIPFTREKLDGNIPFTLYVSNLPITSPSEEDDKKQQSQYAVTIEEIRDLFTTYGNLAIVKLRFKPEEEDESGNKHAKKSIPVGAALVEFETKEALHKAAVDVLTCKEGVEVEPKRKLTIGGNELIVVTLNDFIAEKKKKKQPSDKKEDGEGQETKKREREEKSDDVGEQFKVDWKPHCVIELKGLSSTCDREAILKAVAGGLNLTMKEVKEKKVYADFSRGQTDGAIRFAEPLEEVDDLAEKLNNGDIKIDGSKVKSAKVLEGDEEAKYWQNYADFKKKLQRHNADERASNKRRKSGKRR
jgi:hypothetical protein